MVEIPCDITDPLGLHVQLAVLLASEAQRWRSSVTLEHAGRSVGVSQPMELMMLGIRCGEHIDHGDVLAPDAYSRTALSNRRYSRPPAAASATATTTAPAARA